MASFKADVEFCVGDYFNVGGFDDGDGVSAHFAGEFGDFIAGHLSDYMVNNKRPGIVFGYEPVGSVHNPERIAVIADGYRRRLFFKGVAEIQDWRAWDFDSWFTTMDKELILAAIINADRLLTEVVEATYGGKNG